ncbi:MAG: hypothetical protein E3J87_05525, partial [Candidatus Cloacimonadota bacterium]
MDKRIRVYKEKDLNEILAFTKTLYASGYVPYLLDYHKKHPERTIPFVFEEKKVLKALCFFHFSTRDDGWLMGMRVRKECQKSGVATIFTRELVEYSEKKGLSWIGLNTSFKNRSVHHICKRLNLKRYEAYYIYEFNLDMLKKLKQKKSIDLIEFNKKDEVNEYLNKKKIKRLLFVLDPGFIWTRITDTALNNLTSGKNLYLYNKKLISLQRWGKNIVFNIFGNYRLSEYEELLAQLYREIPENSKGRIILCVRRADDKGILKLYNKIETPDAIKNYDVERSDW